MADERRVSAASVKQRLLDLARREGRVHEVVLVRYALERLLYRLSISRYRDEFILKGGMLVTQWLGSASRETRDADDLDKAVAATFARRRTAIPAVRPDGLPHAFASDADRQRQWNRYAASIGLNDVSLQTVVEAAWQLVGPSCVRLLQGAVPKSADRRT